MTGGPVAGRVLVQGASRGIGRALVDGLLSRPAVKQVFATCRRPQAADDLRHLSLRDSRLHVISLDVEDAESIQQAAGHVAELSTGLDLLINCAGVLQAGPALQPERRLADVQPVAWERAMRVNALGPLLVAQAFEALLRQGDSPCFAAVSARVGSIADNRLGGWYAYRGSKAALNMYLRNLSIEWGRGQRPIRVLAYHPGTVATDLSRDFLASATTRYRILSPEEASTAMLRVLDSAAAENRTGDFLDWQGEKLAW